MTERSAEEQTHIDTEIQITESQLADYFADMETDGFIQQGISIFRSATEGIPVVNEGADKALETLLSAIINGTAPEPFMGGRTAAAWRMYTAELIRRVARNQETEFRAVPLPE